MRHRNGRAGERIVCGEVTIDLARHEVTRDKAVIALTPREFALLVALARHAGRMVTHKALLREVWGEAHLDDVEYLRVVVRSLRQKLEADPGQPRLITNDPGIGYRLNGD
jgi:two-component system KDP operon response regulator KdpE